MLRHAVNGGQGMNTGLSDAFNLIWRLNLAINFPNLTQQLQHDLLNSYDVERRATAVEVVRTASELVRSTKDKAKSYVDLIEKNSGFITGMGVSYASLKSPLVVESQKGIFKAGERCPDLWLQEAVSRDTHRLYSKLVYGRYLLLVINDTTTGFIIGKSVSPFLSVMALKPLEAMRAGVANPGCTNPEKPRTSNAFGCSWVKEDERYAVLVRPDCYIEVVEKTEKVAAYLDSRFPGMLKQHS